LGVHRIDGRIEKLTKNLSVVQGLIHESKFEEIVFDIGSNLFHPILELADEINLVARVGFNTLARLSELDLQPSTLILNFSERSKAQQKWVQQIADAFPRLKIIKVPLDSKNFESAAESRSALMEVASNSLARKSIATLG
jgi:Flp pilus assembly CpaE family ATPase